MNDELRRTKVCSHGVEWRRCDTCSPRAPEHGARSTPECAPLHPDIQLAYEYVESVRDHPDAYTMAHQPLWHGWALREAFLAGMTAQQGRAKRWQQGRDEIVATLERWLEFDAKQRAESGLELSDEAYVMLNGFENAPPTWPTRKTLQTWIAAIRNGTNIQVNNDEVICPNCNLQFRAVPVNVQNELAAAKANEARYLHLRDVCAPVTAMHHLQHSKSDCDERIDTEIARYRAVADRKKECGQWE